MKEVCISLATCSKRSLIYFVCGIDGDRLLHVAKLMHTPFVHQNDDDLDIVEVGPSSSGR